MSPPPTPVVKPSRNLRSRALSLPPRRRGVNLPDIPTASAHPPPLPRDGAITPDHRKRPTASTTAASTFTTVAGRNTTPLNRATVAPSASPPLQNTFALLDAADEPHALAAGTVAAGTFFDTAEVDADDQTEGTAREDGDSQPLLDLDGILALDGQLTRLSLPSPHTTGSLRRRLPGSPKPIVRSIWLSLGSPQLSMTTTTMSPMPPQWRC